MARDAIPMPIAQRGNTVNLTTRATLESAGRFRSRRSRQCRNYTRIGAYQQPNPRSANTSTKLTQIERLRDRYTPATATQGSHEKQTAQVSANFGLVLLAGLFAGSKCTRRSA